MKRSAAPARKTPLRRSTYRTLRSDEPTPEGEPLIYDTSDGRRMKRWKVGVREYVEQVVRDESGRPIRSRPIVAKRIDVKEAVRLYEEGDSLPVIAETLGCDSGALFRALRRHGVEMRSPTDYATPIRLDDVTRRYGSGQTVRHIARSLGVSDRRVREVLYTSGLKERRPGWPKGRGKKGGSVSFDTEFDAMKPAVHARSGGRCEAQASKKCTGRAVHVHHRRMRSQGGTNDLDNLLDLCGFCHSWIHANPAASYVKGWLLRRSVPV